ncbi:hypothetical protein [Candidatus Pelagibacter sp. HIMB1506]|uniref:hypothetical protein n=1 Tax=Candidatus Pelagibacter sp. HIMB1506 TaxID=3413337 RepID=UPI003F85A668
MKINIDWYCFSCGGVPFSNHGVSVLCNNCGTKCNYGINEELGELQGHDGQYAVCDKCDYMIQAPICICGSKLLPFKETIEKIKKFPNKAKEYIQQIDKLKDSHSGMMIAFKEINNE